MNFIGPLETHLWENLGRLAEFLAPHLISTVFSDNDFRRLRNERREVRQSVLMEGACRPFGRRGEPLRRIIMTDWIRPESRGRENSMRDSLRLFVRGAAGIDEQGREGRGREA